MAVETNKISGKEELVLSVDYSASSTHGDLSSLCAQHNVSVPNDQVMREWFLLNEKSSKLELQQRRIQNASQAVGPPPFQPFCSVTSSLPKSTPVTWVFVLLLALLTFLTIRLKKNKN